MDNKADKIKYGNNELENLWSAVCCNDIAFMKNYYTNGGTPNKRYNKFNNANSLIMGALRNQNHNMVDLLKQNGETLLVDEVEEYQKLMLGHDYKDDLTEISNINKVQDLLDRAQEHRKKNISLPQIESRLTPKEREDNTKSFNELIDKIYKTK